LVENIQMYNYSLSIYNRMLAFPVFSLIKLFSLISEFIFFSLNLISNLKSGFKQ